MNKATELQTVELRNKRGDSARILTLGGIVSELNIATTGHGLINIILGYPHLHNYLNDSAYHGAIAGRYCNRIANSRFSIGERHYDLASNEGRHHLHGGSEGFNRRLWSLQECSSNSMTLALRSHDGDQGYPGNLDVLLNYLLNDEGALDIRWKATTDMDTIVGLTSHSYFNLAGHGDILDHYLRIPVAHYTPVDDELVPTGKISPVDGSALDLQKFTRLRNAVFCDDPQLASFGGLDHNWARGSAGEMQLSAELLCPDTNLLLQTSSTLPGLQCYTGNHLMSNGPHGRHEGVCLEPQYYPNSPNETDFPSPLLRAGETVQHRIRYYISEVNAAAFLANG